MPANAVPLHAKIRANRADGESMQKGRSSKLRLFLPPKGGRAKLCRGKRQASHAYAFCTARHFGNMGTSINDKWYVGQVLAGKEAATLAQCRRLVGQGVLHESFVPEYETMWKTAAGWRPERRLLFPGYLFFVTDNVEALAAGLANVPNRVRILGDEENSFMALSDSERDWFLAFIDQDRIVRMSEGIIENDQVRITKGPLMGKEARIRKIDRHKRSAFVEVGMFGRKTMAKVGLEIVRKA